MKKSNYLDCGCCGNNTRSFGDKESPSQPVSKEPIKIGGDFAVKRKRGSYWRGGKKCGNF